MTAGTWLVTGASSGLGRALARAILERGGRVAACVRSPATVADLADQHGARLWVGSADMVDTPAIRELVGAAFSDLGRIDVVVSNAGYGLFGAAEEATDDQVDHQIATNLTGSIQLFRSSVPHLRDQGGGRFLQISSMGGQVGFPCLSVYNATKWGIEGFLEAAAQEVAPFKIGVTIVEPGGMRTDFAHRGAVTAPPMTVYEGTAVEAVRRVIAEPGTPERGDPEKIAHAIIEGADMRPSTRGPERLVLGSDAYLLVRGALAARLAAVENGYERAFSTDADDVVHERAG
jgi:NAD(P)-dependent dehydrogenase (short-subunit alcohol dehydrogenase family)